ncbi:DUF4352 domain-containing protein [Streptomyces sp. NPDC057638]|uniref:DUF4352 domain-containing protein n=1 Tax=Streptomyces sp. NPDC057638 TaxID=3346190 RepID=UPI003694ADED
MRHLASALLLAALAFGGTGCRAAADNPDPAVSDPKGRRTATGAWFGDSVDLRGSARGERLRMRVKGWVDPAVPVRTGAEPEDGTRWVGAEVELVNVGGRAYDLAGGALHAFDGTGTRYRPVRTGTLTTGSPLAWGSLAAGEQKTGWLVFAVPEKARIVRVLGTVGEATAGWRLQHPPSR